MRILAVGEAADEWDRTVAQHRIAATTTSGVKMQPMPALSKAQFESLCAAAMAAPSADNKHVFRLESCADGLRVLATDEFLQARGSRRILGLISLGAALQNLQIRGAALGIRLEAAWHIGDGVGSRLIAGLSARTMAAASEPLESALEARHSNRRLRFTGPVLSPAEQHRFAQESASVEGADLVWLDTPASRSRSLRLIRRAESERFRNEELHRELFGSIRFDVGWHASASEGLPAGALELPVFERPAFLALRRWPVQRIANILGVHRFIGLRAADLPCRLAPHLCVVTATGPVEVAAVNAGRLLQRLWLRATLLGWSFQVFAASPLYALEGSTSISQELRDALATGWAELCPAGRAFVVFRMGHAAAPSVRAGRPSVDQLQVRP